MIETPVGCGQRRLVEAKAEAGRIRVGRDGGHERAVLGPVHRADIEFRAGLELLHPLARELEHRLDAHRRLEAHGFGRAIEPRAMLVEIGRHPLEGARAVEHARAQPEGVRARPDDRVVALEPFAIEEGEGLRPGGHGLLIHRTAQTGGSRRAPRTTLIGFGTPEPARIEPALGQSSGKTCSASAPSRAAASPTRTPAITRSGAISASGTRTKARLNSSG